MLTLIVYTISFTWKVSDDLFDYTSQTLTALLPFIFIVLLLVSLFYLFHYPLSLVISFFWVIFEEKKLAMAMGLVTGSQGGHYNGKMTPFVILSCMMAAMGGVIFGYDIGISGLSL